MKVYIAAPWVDRELAREFAKRVEDRGITITHKWWEIEGEESDIEKMEQCARLDWNGVADADRLILLNTRKSEGKAFEQGLACAFGIPIIAVGIRGAESKNVFHYLPDYTWVDDTEGVWDVLSTVRV